MIRFLLPAALFCFSFGLKAQNTRIRDNNRIGWWTFNGTWSLKGKWGLQTEYQWRREGLVSDWQQSLVRVGVNYQASARVLLRAGYAWAETYPYGDIPLQAAGRTFTEHRAFEMMTLSDKIGRFDLSHRFILEQRWVGRYLAPSAPKEDDYAYVNRGRYMFRVQIPLLGKTLDDKEPYFAAYDEILIGFGKNVNENIFDQNRIGLVAAYRFNRHFRIEAGYVEQRLLLGREIDGRSVLQFNRGLLVNLFVAR